jgi:hypothetical protein
MIQDCKIENKQTVPGLRTGFRSRGTARRSCRPCSSHTQRACHGPAQSPRPAAHALPTRQNRNENTK